MISDSVKKMKTNVFKTMFVTFCSEYGGEDREVDDETLSSFHDQMSVPVNTKWSKAVKRITGKEPTHYTSVHYNDSAALSLPLFDGLEIDDKNKDMWSCFFEMASISSLLMDWEEETPPTREEIRTNIEEFRMKSREHDGKKENDGKKEENNTKHDNGKEEEVSKRKGSKKQDTTLSKPKSKEKERYMEQAFVEEVSLLLREVDCPFDPQIHTEKRWSEQMQIKCGASGSFSFEEVCNREMVNLLSEETWKFEPSLLKLNKNNMPWTRLKRLNSICKVNTAIPTDMMSHIESIASKLAQDVSNGKSNSFDLNEMTKIGQQVASKCSSKDMSSLSKNIEGLLPALMNLRQ